MDNLKRYRSVRGTFLGAGYYRWYISVLLRTLKTLNYSISKTKAHSTESRNGIFILHEYYDPPYTVVPKAISTSVMSSCKQNYVCHYFFLYLHIWSLKVLTHLLFLMLFLLIYDYFCLPFVCKKKYRCSR